MRVKRSLDINYSKAPTVFCGSFKSYRLDIYLAIKSNLLYEVLKVN